MDDRPLEDAETAVSRIDAKIADMESTILARLSRLKSVGDVEPAFRPSAKEGTLFMQGQAVSRTTYAALWAWVQEVGAVYTGGYGNGDGTTTFTLPDLRGRVLMGTGTLGSDVYALGATGGASSRVLTTANMPAHDHNVTVANHSGHYHSINSGTGDSGGNHGGHVTGTFGTAAGAQFPTSQGNNGNNAHNHDINTDTGTDGISAHSVGESSVGTGTAFDNRPPYLAINWAVWT